MSNGRPDFDVVVVGASAAGCTAAKLYAERGARVALVERRPDMDAHKVVCTHYIQPSATPTLERLGLVGPIEARGAVRNPIDVWTPYSGWIRHRADTLHGYNVTRRTLDPLLRRMTAETPGVELMLGQTATELLMNGRPQGVVVEDARRARRELRGRLVVAADGRDSRLARMARVPGRVRPHNRFFHWAYWRGVPSDGGRSRMWIMEPDSAYTFPNEDDLTVVLVGPHRDRREEFRSDLEGAYERYVAALPDPPDLSRATRESKILGKLDLPNVSRPAARPGIAFVGDAALASDPLWGGGCGWALQSGSSTRRPMRSSPAATSTSTRRSSATGACIASASGRTTSSSPTSPPGARRTRSSAACTARRWTTTTSSTSSRGSARGAGRRRPCSRRASSRGSRARRAEPAPTPAGAPTA
jgi:flavin-dependent dehydrogenase